MGGGSESAATTSPLDVEIENDKIVFIAKIFIELVCVEI